MERSRRGDSDAELALLTTRRASRRFNGSIELSEHRTGVLQEGAAGIGHFDAAGLAAQQLHVELRLDGFYLLAERWLLDAKPLCGPGNVPFLGNRNEVAEVPQFHLSYPKDMDFAVGILWLNGRRKAIRADYASKLPRR